ncbi:MAG: 4-hydroxy-tetrahydrodipicolinate synthase [Actinobacteria bacterium]|nr:4-hydroxy-tetrahydrodipicolinate synthase [Actinomycetota bacterium]MBO0835327.1 4-hydroxy-tetrahydrodipicolinate synthase [Actinomycetota bacterium]
MTKLAGLFVPLITPFAADGELAEAALERLAHRVLDDGATGIVALGTTAEHATLTDAERTRVLQVCARVCGSRGAPLIAGAGGNDTARSAAALTALRGYPEICAALTVVPYYSRPGEAGVIEHVRALADSSPVPLVIYNIPYRTGQSLSWTAIGQLAALPAVAGIKHAAGGIDADTIQMMARRPDGFAVLAGDDLYASPLLALGADGAILASAHIRTAEFASLVGLWRSGQAAQARDVGHLLAPLSAALFAEPNPAVIKAVLYRLGEIPSPAVRLPLLPASEPTATAAMEAACGPTDAARVPWMRSMSS